MKHKKSPLFWLSVAVVSLIVGTIAPNLLTGRVAYATGTPDQSITPTQDKALTECKGGDDCGLIKTYINPFIAFLSAGVGLAVTISIIVAGIQYSSSGGDPQKSAAAKNRIRNALFALVAFVLLLGFLRFLTPGGI